MSEKRFDFEMDSVDSSVINITRDGEPFAWFLSDVITDKQVEKVVDLLNSLSDENEQLRKANELLEQGKMSALSDLGKALDENEQYKDNDFKTIWDMNGYVQICCPKCNSDLEYCRQVAYPNGDVYFEFDCTSCDFSGRIRKENLYECW